MGTHHSRTLVPTLCVGTDSAPLCGAFTWLEPATPNLRRTHRGAVQQSVPTQSVGTRVFYFVVDSENSLKVIGARKSRVTVPGGMRTSVTVNEAGCSAPFFHERSNWRLTSSRLE